ncbi:4281_t:CDS:1, partial [Ambispora leptoticha]
FTLEGIAAGSLAAAWQATYHGFVVAGSCFSILQSIAASGGSIGIFIPAIIFI